MKTYFCCLPVSIKLHRWFLPVLIAGLLTQSAIADESGSRESADLERLFTELSDSDRFNGAVLVARKGDIVFEKISGINDFTNADALTEQSTFELASVSKVLTAVAIHQLVERQLLSYEDSLNHFFPELPYTDVTIAGLLSHTSGFVDVYQVEELRNRFYEFYDNSPMPYTNSDYLEFLEIAKPPLLAAPGAKTSYSNTAYVLLGLIIEQVANNDYADYLSKNIFDVADMPDTFVINKGAPGNTNRLAKGHNKLESGSAPVRVEGHTPGKPYGITFGDDEVVSNLRDLYKFDSALGSGRLLTRATLAKMLSPVMLATNIKSSFGLGIRIDIEDGTRRAYHTGSTAGFRSYFQSGLSDDGTTIILLTNVADPEIRLAAIAAEIRNVLANSDDARIGIKE